MIHSVVSTTHRRTGRCLQSNTLSSIEGLVQAIHGPLSNRRTVRSQHRSLFAPVRRCESHVRSSFLRKRITYSYDPLPKRLIYQHNFRFSSCLVLRLFDESNFLSLVRVPIHRPTLSDDEKEDDLQRNVTILCTSPTTLCEENDSLIQRIIHWILGLWKQCHNAALVTIRGSEIIIRMSPLLILTPASILAAKVIRLTGLSVDDASSSSVDHYDDTYEEYAPIRRLKTQLLSTNQMGQDKSRFTKIQTNNVISDLTWDYFLNAVTALGPAFVKLCQWVATRRDIFPPHVCNRLALLHDRGICHDWSHSQEALVQAFGPDYKENGLHIEHDSVDKTFGVIGCGSAAQVYRGTLVLSAPGATPTSTQETTSVPVAIKVLHPRFHKLVERDLWFMQSVADMIHTIPLEYIRMLNFPRVARNFGSILQLQSDLRCEATNLIKFRTNFYGTGTEEESSIFFPKPIDNWISEQVLVEQLVENAVPISEYLKNDSTNATNTASATCTQEIRKELAIPLLNAFLKMVFWDNFVHCDLHPGNVLVRTYQPKKNEQPSMFNFYNTSSKEELKRQIVFLDAGISFQLEKEDQRNLVDLFRAVVTDNGYEAGRLMVERAKYERCSQIEGGVDAFSTGIGEIVSEFHDRRKTGLTLGAVRIGSLLTRVLDLCRYHGVEIDPSMASVIISTLVLEGLGRALEPRLNLIDFALPFIMGRGKV